MTRVDDTITLRGDSATVTRKTDGAADGYGDPAETWATATTEYVFLVRGRPTRRYSKTPLGALDESEYRVLLLSTSTIAVFDKITIGSEVYEVLGPIVNQYVGSELSHKESAVRVLKEG